MDISVVIPLLNEEESLLELHDWIVKVMQSNRYSYEILFVDDGSTDNSWKVINQLSEKLNEQHEINAKLYKENAELKDRIILDLQNRLKNYED